MTPAQATRERASESMTVLLEALWSGPVGIALLDRELRFVRVNDALAAMTELAPEVHVGRTLGDLFPVPDDPRRGVAERARTILEAVMESGRPLTSVALSATLADGTPRSWLCSFLPVPSEGGGTEGVCALVTDATDAHVRQSEVARARDRAQETARRLALLQEVTAGLSSAIDAEGIARVVVERVRIAAGAMGTVFWLLRGDLLEVVDEAGVPAIRRRFATLPITGALPAAEAARLREPVWVHSAEEIARFPDAAAVTKTIGVCAAASMPLVIHGRALGVFALLFAEPRAFDHDERAFLLSVAEQCAQALERAELLEAERAQRGEAQRARDRVARLQSVTAALSRASTVSDVARVLVTQAKEALGVSSSLAFVLDDSDAQLHLAAAIGPAERAREVLATLPLDAPVPVAVAARTGEVIWLESAEQMLAAFPELPRFAPYAAELHALVVLPLKVAGAGGVGAVGERVLGAVSFGFDAPPAFCAGDRELVAAVAQQCAQALDRARLLDAERQARAAEARTRALLDGIFDNAPLGIGLIDRELRFARVNPVLAEMNGMPAEAHVGKTPRELLPHLPHDEVEAAFREILRTGLPKIEIELSGETPASPGCLRHWRESWYPVRLADEAFGIGVLVRETTHEHQAQEFQRNVLGIVGHDLRNPLSAITVSAQLLLRQAGDAAAATRLAERIAANAERMQRIIAVLVDYTRVRGGSGIPLRRRPCDLAASCRAVIEECETSHPGRVVKASGGVDVHGEWDPDRVAQIVANLLSNALDYSPPGSVVEVSWRADGARAVVEVANEGSPIPPEILPALFEPFRRGERERPGGKDGLGLGLFIARSIATAHGGTLEVRSAPGERIVFTFTLPLS
jgi:PAS domain S-box-containing protein